MTLIRFPWATDTNHPAGGDPWSAQPNKIAPSAPRRAQGWPPAIRPSAEHFNYLLNEIGAKFDEVANKFQGRNWVESAVTGSPTPGNLVTAGVYSPYLDGFFFINADGEIAGSYYDASIITQIWGNKGSKYKQEIDLGVTLSWAAGGLSDIAGIDVSTQTRCACAGDSTATNVDQVGYSSSAGTWAASTAGLTSTYAWQHVAYTNGIWVIAGTGGAIAYKNTTWPGSWTEATPFSAIISALRGNRETGGDALFVAASNSANEIGYSADGASWTVSSWTNTILAIGYSSMSGKWIAVNDDGDIDTSTDGISWTRHASLLPDSATLGTMNTASIAIDDKGCVVITGTYPDGFSWCSFDDGVSFERLNYDNGISGSSTQMKACAAGGKRFAMFGKNRGLVSLIGDY